MLRYIAFLRAINVGGRVVKMERLRAVFDSLGLRKVETFIASGNVIFEACAPKAATLEKKIEQALQKELGYGVRTFLRTEGELAEIARYSPFQGAGDGKLFTGFMEAAPSKEAGAKLLGFQTELEQFHLHGRELYWRIQGNSSDSKFSGPLLEKTLGVAATIRNANTVRKLAAKYPADR
ncbi:MAG: DUF1697 domain-containing protein [Chthoniobacterales bacterium]|nr:DUF1697 domain-containing protein [Chthoniobacterales bacterium]